MNKSILAAAFAASCMVCASASAGTTFHDGSLPLATTNWDINIDVPQFDDMGGTRVLKSISVFLEGFVSGSASGESTDNEPSVISLNLGAEISLSLGGNNIAVVLPIANEMFNASAFDGQVDFSGTSGASFPSLSADDSIKELLTLGNDDLSPWIGGGNVTLVGTANAQSSGSGPGNLVQSFQTNASLNWSVEYDFNIVPTPGAAVIFAIAGVGATRRRR